MGSIPDDQRGLYAPFIAVVAVGILMLSSVAYDGTRLIAARQHTLHAAQEAARVAASVVASGGTLADAEDAAKERLERIDQARPTYSTEVYLGFVRCIGTQVEVNVVSEYFPATALSLLKRVHPIGAAASAEAYLLPPSKQPSELIYLSECSIS